MTSLPLVSVIIPCYNAENFVESAVRSIMEQTYSNLEIIVINDCSSDNTGEILKRLAEEDPRIKYIENEQNLKLPKTLNKGINLAKGDYIARMDSDDISLPVRLEKQVEFMLSNKNIDIVGCNMQHMDVYSRRLLYRSHMSTEHNDII
ncbi:glycosyltransferase family 2 protein, partial [Glaesserella parasuis]|nr:glycosyltransferase family 2 protein [Glaesserella parasuis]